MGWVQELSNLIGTFKFYEIVYEYQQGLYFRCGKTVELPVRLTADEKHILRASERKVIRDNGGYRRYILPFSFPNIPRDYSRSFWTGLPRHKKRRQRSRILRPGLYFHLPLIDDIIKDSNQERVLNLGNISVPTTDECEKSRVMVISCNIRYKLMDIYRACIKIDDYEDSIKDHTLSILAELSRGKMYEEWKDPGMVSVLENRVRDEVRKVATEKWGLEIIRIYVTDNVSSNVERMMHETSVSMNTFLASLVKKGYPPLTTP